MSSCMIPWYGIPSLMSLCMIPSYGIYGHLPYHLGYVIWPYLLTVWDLWDLWIHGIHDIVYMLLCHTCLPYGICYYAILTYHIECYYAILTYHMGFMDIHLYAWYHATWYGIHDIMSYATWYGIHDTVFMVYIGYMGYHVIVIHDTWYYLVSLIPAILYYTILYCTILCYTTLYMCLITTCTRTCTRTQSRAAMTTTRIVDHNYSDDYSIRNYNFTGFPNSNISQNTNHPTQLPSPKGRRQRR